MGSHVWNGDSNLGWGSFRKERHISGNGVWMCLIHKTETSRALTKSFGKHWPNHVVLCLIRQDMPSRAAIMVLNNALQGKASLFPHWPWVVELRCFLLSFKLLVFVCVCTRIVRLSENFSWSMISRSLSFSFWMWLWLDYKHDKLSYCLVFPMFAFVFMERNDMHRAAATERVPFRSSKAARPMPTLSQPKKSCRHRWTAACHPTSWLGFRSAEPCWTWCIWLDSYSKGAGSSGVNI